MKKFIFSSFTLRCCFFIATFSATTHAQTTIKYQYDSLGRVTFVEDTINGSRDYDYDSVGNRVLVSAGQTTDDPPVPAAPTGLSCSQIAPGAWKGSWSPVSGTAYYIYRTTDPYSTNETKETGTSAVKNYSCTWVKACNSSNVCSSKSYF